MVLDKINHGFHFTQKSLLYTAKTLLGAAICWYGLVFLGMRNPIWAVITVIIVSDADLTSTATLAKARIINTIVGCLSGIISLSIFGYSPMASVLTATLTVFIVTSLEYYPANWRLAPVTVIILMDAGRQAISKESEILYAFMRASEIGAGCVISLLLALVFNQISGKLQGFLPTKIE